MGKINFEMFLIYQKFMIVVGFYILVKINQFMYFNYGYFREDIFMVREVILVDIKFEQVLVFYNIGVLYFIFGFMETRINVDVNKFNIIFC